MYKALVIGSSGAVGSHVLRNLIRSSLCLHVTALGRKSLDVSDPKLTSYQVDMNRLARLTSPNEVGVPPLKDQYDVAFCTVGTRAPADISEAAGKHINVDILKGFVKLSKAKGVRYYGFLSFYNANAQSSHLLARTKGQAEEAIKEERFERMTMFRPAWINRPKPDAKAFDSNIHYWMARYDHFLRHNFRFMKPLMYTPLFLLPPEMHNTEDEKLGFAMVRDAERFLKGEDEDEMRKKVGFKGLKRLYAPDINQLASK